MAKDREGKGARGKKQASGEEAGDLPLVCPVDAAALDYRGFCELGRGYPEGMRCPFVCPLCRKRLSWSGACLTCFGTSTGRREDWSIPGDRYELQGRHWVFISGPGRVIGPEDHMALTQNIREMLEGKITAQQGRLRAQVILAKYPDNPAPASGGTPF